MQSLYDVLSGIVRRSSLEARGTSVHTRRRRDPTRPAATWVADARVAGRPGKAIAVVLATQGCSHARSEDGGCTMCSYLLDGTSAPVTSDDLVLQFRSAMQSAGDLSPPVAVKVYTSGSFLDPCEVPLEARERILQLIASDDRVEEVVLESRPEFVTGEALSGVRSVLDHHSVQVGVGLESSSDPVRMVAVNKGFTTDQFRATVEVAAEYEVGVRAYVLLKPPFLTERDALVDALETIVAAADMGVRTVSVNPVNIQRNTLVERLWRRGLYAPPWLWTLVELLRTARGQVAPAVEIVSDPVAAGKRRGPHNCGLCDPRVTRGIRAFSLSQDVRHLHVPVCSCINQWRYLLVHEDMSLLVGDGDRLVDTGSRA